MLRHSASLLAGVEQWDTVFIYQRGGNEKVWTLAMVKGSKATGSLHVPSLEDELTQPSREYLGKNVKVENGHTAFKPTIPLGGGYILQMYSHTRAPWCMFKVIHSVKTRHNEISISRGMVPWIMARPHHKIYTALKRRRQLFYGLVRKVLKDTLGDKNIFKKII